MTEFLVLVKSKLFWFILILVGLGAVIEVMHIEINRLDGQIVTLNKSLAQKTQAVTDCDNATKQMKTDSDALQAKLKKAQDDAAKKSQVHYAKSKSIMALKPSSNSDYDATNELINSVLSK